ncbi:hypothetical protein QWI17_06305 [Gilvimarinus sp. SDUM040013]|uniref:DUF3313 domain-containing protein n=1 Tax=Gilvimarinus gilvus TaxID=3058038 RepID=A0ABU4S5F3_9GAMM|nr:hypothetical protein [Gilvimarinus sp. SDUM040013]MDO3385450.1 hypothetical protein [Gilvimarinus sp. SDUM040013]MDX6851133.1 hypothetical protein [Gilvimarinus sp. SDUM040013]
MKTQFFFWLLACALTPVVFGASSTQGESGKAKVATVMPESQVENFSNWDDSSFSTFFYDTTVNFSQYDQAIFFPMTFDRMELAQTTNDEYLESWSKSSFNEMDKICQFFDDFLMKKFKSSRYITPTLKGGPNVLAIEFRMKDFMPMSMRREDALGTVGSSTNAMGVGILTFQAVLVESQTGRLVAVIEDGMNISSGTNSVDDRIGRNMAWRRSFRDIVAKLHQDFKMLEEKG